MQKPERRWIGAFVILLVLVGLIAYVGITNPVPPKTPTAISSKSRPEVKRFQSESEFKSYISEGVNLNSVAKGRGVAEASLSLDAPMMGIGAADENVSDTTRYSSTNIQVQGIDEPDILKTDGRAIYYSLNTFYEYFPLWERSIMSEPNSEDITPNQTSSAEASNSLPVDLIAPDSKLIAPEILPPNRNSTKIITTRTGAELEVSSSLDTSGQLLLSDSTLVVISGSQLHAYDVSNSSSPQAVWSEEFDSNSSIVATRLFANKLYVTTMQWVNSASPCPIPLTTRGTMIACTDIYYPVQPISVNSTYTVSVLDVTSGSLDSSVTFVGSQGQTVVYMSPQNLYVTYGYEESLSELMFDFFTDYAADLLPRDTVNRIQLLSEYELYEQTKITELYAILEHHYTSLTNDERRKLESEIQNKGSEYMKGHMRDVQKTGIIQIALNDLTVRNTASVPGYILNQFSLDEYEDNLRVATTTSSSFMFGTNESVNDLYVLDNSLKIRGSVQDLGLSERIYSARFVGDKGYVVTFKQIDPFYVFDLSDPDNPRKSGELKIPGYSSYLHPLTDDLVLGLGRDGGRVKATLFSVSDPSNPVELSTYVMNESWSEIENNHHAFLQDSDFSVFFIPASNGGYVFSYKDNTLTLQTAVADIQAERALYINNYLYVVGKEKIVVLDESSWERVSDLSF